MVGQQPLHDSQKLRELHDIPAYGSVRIVDFVALLRARPRCHYGNLVGRYRQTQMPDEKHPTPAERDEPVKIDLDPDTALKAIMETGPHRENEPVDEDSELRHDAE